MTGVFERWHDTAIKTQFESQVMEKFKTILTVYRAAEAVSGIAGEYPL